MFLPPVFRHWEEMSWEQAEGCLSLWLPGVVPEPIASHMYLGDNSPEARGAARFIWYWPS